MERIIAAAYKVKPEYIFKGEGCVLKTNIKEKDDIYQCRIGRHHTEIIHIWGNEINHHTDGFYYFGGKKLDSSDIFDLDYNGNML
jgi:hypothetical protein